MLTYDNPEQKRYIYQALKSDDRYNPPIRTIVCEKPTEVELVEWLENNGGGIYRNILHNFEYEVKPKKQGGHHGRDQ